MKLQKWCSVLLYFFKENVISIVLFVGIFAILLFGLSTTQEGSSQEGLRIVEESISRSIVSCYAIEGQYPSDLAYLQDNYGLSIDESKYYVRYEVFATNIMPEVTIIEVGT